MMRIFSAAMGIVLVGTVAAQEPQPPASQAPAARVPPEASRYKVFFDRRARLGITVNVRARQTDSIGAYVNGVTPSGPAAKAGLRSGDIITKLGRTPLVGTPGDADREDSAPGLRLIELAAKLEPNDTVSIEFRRGKESKTTRLVTSDEPGFIWTAPNDSDRWHGLAEPRKRGREMPLPEQKRLEEMRSNLNHMRMGYPEEPLMFAFGSALSDLELAPVNPDLGRYFGVEEGVLVIDVPEVSKLNLKAGDVVLSVDGRKPTNPGHLLRILRSYDDGEFFKIDIVRMKKRETVTGQVGEPPGER